MNQNKQKWVCIVSGGFLSLLFILLIFSPENIDTHNTTWVKNGGGDNLQHYLGWLFFRNSSWNRYILYMRNLNYPIGTSVIVTDSNPLFCLIFKIFRNFLPLEFQFNGIWIVISFVLIGLLSVVIFWEISHNVVLSITGSVLSIMNPVLLQRALIHDTLIAHWLILAGILLLIHYDKWWNISGWFLLAEAALLIHVYFVPMISFILILQLIRMVHKKQPYYRMVILVIGFMISLLFGYYVLGYNHILPQSGSFGELSLNLNAFINPDTIPAIIKPRPIMSLQYEGFNYLGLGVIFFQIIGLAVGRKKYIQMVLPYMFPLLLLILISASNVGYFDEKQLYHIKLPEQIISVLSVFRSSGRLVWPIYYLILVSVIAAVSNKNENKDKIRKNRLVEILAVICVMLQIIDLNSYHKDTASRFRSPENKLPEIPAELSRMISGDVSHLFCSEGDSKTVDALALFAAENKMSFNRNANARGIKHIFGGDETDLSQLSCDMLLPDSAYVYLSEDSFPEKLFECENITIMKLNNWKIVSSEKSE